MECSIVVPVYFNENSLVNAHKLIKEQLLSLKELERYEIIFIDDGSGDNSYNELLTIYNNDKNVKLIKLTRNFGQVAAIYAGYEKAKYECIITMSADMQDPPELINQLLEGYYNEKYEIVICSREDRDEGYFRKATSKFFYHIIQKFVFKSMPIGGFDYVLLSKRVVSFLLKNKDSNPFWQGNILWVGFKHKLILYKRLKRPYGKSRWSFSKKIKYLIDGILSFSYLPIRIMSIFGLILFLIGVIYSGVITYKYFMGNTPFKGWAPIMITILILSGIQMLMIGIIGEYIWRTLDQVRKRDLYLIDEIKE